MVAGNGEFSAISTGAHRPGQREVRSVLTNRGMGQLLTVGSGSVWLVTTEEGLVRVDAETGAVEARVDDVAARALSIKGEGPLWVLDAEDILWQIDSEGTPKSLGPAPTADERVHGSAGRWSRSLAATLLAPGWRPRRIEPCTGSTPQARSATLSTSPHRRTICWLPTAGCGSSPTGSAGFPYETATRQDSCMPGGRSTDRVTVAWRSRPKRTDTRSCPFWIIGVPPVHDQGR